MDHNWEQHIDEKLRQAAENLTAKAPDRAWEAIEQSLPAIDSEGQMDQALDAKLREGFELNVQKTVQKTAPAFIWDAISNDLPEAKLPAEEVDAKLDAKIKASFLDEKPKATPNKVWWAVNRQLNIDKTWKKISAILEVEPVVNDWRRPMLVALASMLLLLALMKACDLDQKIREQDPILAKQLSHTSTAVELNSVVSTTGQDKVSVVEQLLKTAVKSQQNALPSSKQHILVESNAAVEPVTSTPKLGQEQVNAASANGSSISVQEAQDEETSSEQEDQAFFLELETLPGQELISIGAERGIASIEAVSVNTEESNISEKQTLDNETVVNKNNPTTLNYNTALIPAIQLSSEEAKVEIPMVGEPPIASLSNTSKIKGKVEAGAFLAINSTMLLDNDTREGFSEQSLIQNYFGIAANYGLWAAYNFNETSALVGEFSINADNRQAHGLYQKGVYYIKESVLSYSRVSLAYRHNLWRSKAGKPLQGRFSGQAGFYLGFLKEEKILYDGALFFSALGMYHDLDVGLKLALMQEFMVDRFVFGLGIRSDVGLSNAFKGTARQPASENPTNLIQLGGYISVGYRF